MIIRLMSHAKGRGWLPLKAPEPGSEHGQHATAGFRSSVDVEVRAGGVGERGAAGEQMVVSYCVEWRSAASNCAVVLPWRCRSLCLCRSDGVRRHSSHKRCQRLCAYFNGCLSPLMGEYVSSVLVRPVDGAERFLGSRLGAAVRRRLVDHRFESSDVTVGSINALTSGDLRR